MRQKYGKSNENENPRPNPEKKYDPRRKKLWYQFLKTYPIQFKRQYQIGCYYADFYCYKAKLVVELDGSQHYEEAGQEYDRFRTEYLTRQGILVLRFSNRDVMQKFSSVCEYIHNTVTQRVDQTECQGG